MNTIESRVRTALDDSPFTLRELALRAGMSDDDLSRALQGRRGFAAGELVEISEILGADLHRLITGEQDPRWHVLPVDPADPAGSAVSRADADRSILDDVRLAYEQAGDVPATGDLPQTPAALRALLRPGFTECFAERLAEIDVDVIRLGELSTSHAVRDLGRAVILLPATGSWCEENRRLAHELGRLVLDASDGTSAAGAPSGDAACDEAARAFADELLISEEPIVRHTTAASARRFPAWLISAHLERIAAGDIRRGTLAWMLGVEAGTLDVDETPAPAPLSADELDALLA